MDYAGFLRAMRCRYPGLINLEELLSKGNASRTYTRECRIAMVEVPSDGQPCGAPVSFESPESLRSHLLQTASPQESVHRRVYVLENLNLGYIEVFGTHFNIDPCIFATQIRTTNWTAKNDENNTPKLLSCRDPMVSFTLRYNELRIFDDPIHGGPRLIDASAGRQIDTARGMEDFERIGLVRRCASFWSQKKENGWDGIQHSNVF